MRIYKCTLEPHDFLFFASRDLAKIGVTEKYIHSTALNYAVNYCSRVISFSSQPDYYKDIENFECRVTPAHPLNTVSEICFSYNAVNDLDISTHATGNYPTVGKYYKIDLGNTQTLNKKQKFDFNHFQFFLFAFNDRPPVRVIRLGKKDNYCIIRSQELSDIKVKEIEDRAQIEPSHPINPLEFSGKYADTFPISLISIPPHLLILNCHVCKGTYLEGRCNDKKYRIFPPKDKIKEIMHFYGHD